MANNVKVGIIVDDKGTLKKVTNDSNKLSTSTDKYSKKQKGAAQATSNSTKAFAKMQGGMGGMVGVYAEVASRVFALSAAFQFLKSASDVTNLIAGQEALGAVSGVAYKTLTQGLKDATDGQLSYGAAAKAAAIGTAAGLSPEQLNRLGKAAKNTSIALGRDLGDSFDRLIRGVTKAEPELLDELGIILRLETAKKNYALQIGKTATTLTQFEQSQAVANEVLSQAEQKFGAIEKIMDPAASSLNRFLVSFDSLLNTIKTGITAGLRPVFDFLSGNTLALSASLLLLGKSVLTAILPNFKEMGETAAGAMKKANLGVAEHEAHLENLQRTIKKTQAAMIPSKTQATAAAQSAFGKTVPSTTVKGGGAMDFLMGSSKTDKAKQQANKVLLDAEMQLKKSLDKRRGMFKHMNAQQVADMRAAYNQRIAIIERESNVQKKATMSAGQGLQVLGAQAKVTFASMRAGIVSVGAAAATVGAVIMSFLGWIGIFAMIGSALYAAFQHIFPVPEKIKEAEEAAKSYIDSAKTLNKELEKMASVSREAGLGLGDITAQRGGMASNASFAERLKGYVATAEALGTNSKEATKLRVELVKTVAVLGKTVSPEFTKYGRLLLDNDFLTKGQTASLILLTNKYAEFGAAVKSLPNMLKELNAEFAKVMGIAKEANPLASLTENLNKTAATSTTVLEGMTDSFRKNNDDIQKLSNEIMGMQGVTETITSKPNARGKSVTRDNPEFKRLQKLRAELAKLEDDSAKSFSERSKAIAQNNYLLELEKSIGSRSAEFALNSKKALELREKLTTEKRRGLTIDGRIANLSIKDNELKAKLLETQSRQLFAQTAYETSLKNGGKEVQANNRLALDSINSEVSALQSKLDIAEALTAEQRFNLNMQKEVLGLLKAQNILQLSASKIKQGQALTDSGTTSFGFGQVADQRANKLSELTNTEAQAIIAVKKAEGLAKELGLTQEVATQRAHAVDLARQALSLATQTRVIEENIAMATFNKMRGETQLLAFKTQNFAFSQREQAVQQAALAIIQQKGTITQAELDQVTALVIENEKLTNLYQLQTTLRDSVTSGLAQTLSSLVKGEESSFGDAMLSLAQGVVGSLIDTLAQQLVDGLFNVASATASAATMTAGIIAGGVSAAATMGAAIVTAGAAAAAAMAAGGGVSNIVGMVGGAALGAAPLARTGGILSEGKKLAGYSTGGVARGPGAGYPAVLHGTEAVVPLPNGRSIPVEMQNGGQQTNNVVVNVSSSGQTSTEGSTGPDMDKLGGAIAEAVQKELQAQKRSGGILNPYGVA